MLTNRGYIDGIHVTIYSSTMDPMGYDGFINDLDQQNSPTSPDSLVIYWGYPPTSDPISSKSGSLAA